MEACGQKATQVVCEEHSLLWSDDGTHWKQM